MNIIAEPPRRETSKDVGGTFETTEYPKPESRCNQSGCWKGKKLTMKTFKQAGGLQNIPNERGSRKTTCDLIAVVIDR